MHAYKCECLYDSALPYDVLPRFYCTFEWGFMCGLRDEIDNDVDWKIGRGQMSKFFDTGPRATSDNKGTYRTSPTTLH